MNWLKALQYCSESGEAYGLITVLETRGSNPREPGAKMVFTHDREFDTVGGGALEFESMRIARDRLVQNEFGPYQISFNLSKDLKQCCGGKVTLLIETFPPPGLRLHLFGAGHIAQAMLPILKQMDWRIHWYDSRKNLFPTTIPDHIQTHDLVQVERVIESASSGDYYLIMTHDHALDQALCEAIISRGDAQFCGLIGSNAKHNNFKIRLRKKGFSDTEFAQITCPIGLPQISGKRPVEIAVSVVGQLIKLQTEAGKIQHTEEKKGALPKPRLITREALNR